MSCIRMLALLTLLTSCANPFAEPALSAWNPPVAAAYDWNPCPDWAPYYRGLDYGQPHCTARPFDMDNWAVDQLPMP